MQALQKYNAAAYVRLSKEDLDLAGKNESNSITNQSELIKNFLKTHPEIQMIREYADDGFSGVNFERPSFLKMMEAVKEGIINCIIVKDLSRFGRNYIEVGRYLEEIFPLLGVRFISIIENYDSMGNNRSSDQLVIPFMNLVNDAYCGEASTKTRTSLTMKKQNGDYVGAFTVFGYKRNPENRHQLIIDDDAADVIKRIFRLCIEGMSCGAIAKLLDCESVPCPTEYKKLQGENYVSGRQTTIRAKWSPLTIRIILTNRVYLGILEQGKTYSINYKLKGRISKNPGDWICAPNAHEAIISEDDFELVQKLLMMDLRTSPGKDKVYLFSGILYCSKCGEALIKRKITSRGSTYSYYGCYDKNKKLRCKNICIREDFLEKAVMETIGRHIDIVVEMVDLIENIEQIPLHDIEVKRIEDSIKQKEKEVKKYQNLRIRLYEDYHEEFISKKEYKSLESIYQEKEEECLENISHLISKKSNYINGVSRDQEWIKKFFQHKKVDKLDRTLLLSLVESISVNAKNEIEIHFRYESEFDTARKILWRN